MRLHSLCPRRARAATRSLRSPYSLLVTRDELAGYELLAEQASEWARRSGYRVGGTGRRLAGPGVAGPDQGGEQGKGQQGKG